MRLLRPALRAPEGSRAPLTKSAEKKPLKKGDHLYLVDGSGYLFRAYHALPPLSRKSDGLPTGAVAGYCNMLWKLLEDMRGGEKPTHLAVVFDAGKRTFRSDLYAEYKANRPPPPDDLIPQFPLVREATRAFGVSCIEQEGFEADDLIATYARVGKLAGARVTIVSSDKDLMQLIVDGTVEMLDPVKNKRIGSADVMERFGVPPSKVVEVQALAGDSTDNVPGVRGIGVKTAAELINQFGTLDALLERAGEIKQPKRRETLIENAANARISLKLVTLDQNVNFAEGPEAFAAHDPEPNRLIAFLKAMEFAALMKRVAARFAIENPEAIAAASENARPAPASTEAVDSRPAVSASSAPGGSVGALDRARFVKAIDPAKYETLTSVAAFEKWLTRARDAGALSVALSASGPDPMTAKLCGVALALAPNEASYVPFGHVSGAGLALESGAGVVQLGEKDVLARLKPVLEDSSILKIGANFKSDVLMLLKRGIRLAPYDDIALMSYVLDSGKNGHELEELAALHLEHTPLALSDVLGKGKDKVSFDRLEIGSAARFAAERADLTFRLHALLKPRLAAESKKTVYETLERPLIAVLAEMEFAGVVIDPDLLKKLSNDFAQAMAKLEKEVFRLAGEEFNLGSPKQLGDILFGKFKLPGGRRTKTGAWSTDADILETVAAEGHPIAKHVLDWRLLQKLRGTYTDALPAYINAETNRVHTSYALAATSTGRLASTEPNLQNIPIRTEEGRRIRRAFIAPAGTKLISADYSQIELRLLAHIADIAALRQAFADGLDIHAMTASEMFGVPAKDMPAEIRRRAKAINFGIIYGISAFGLANQLGIPRSEADDYIKRYFKRFPGIRDYMERTKDEARKTGLVTTLFGRAMFIRDINASNPGHRGGAERQAINAPIQGTAADIIRRAMIRIPGALKDARSGAKMLLQVHDELIFEVADSEIEATSKIVKATMEKASLPAVALKVPLTVEVRAAANWDAAH